MKPANAPNDVAAKQPAADTADNALAFSVDQFCRASSLGRSYVYDAISDRRLKSIKHGKRRLILRADAEAFLRGETACDA